MYKLPINLTSLLHHRTVESERVEYKVGWNRDDCMDAGGRATHDYMDIGVRATHDYMDIGVRATQEAKAEEAKAEAVLHSICAFANDFYYPGGSYLASVEKEAL